MNATSGAGRRRAVIILTGFVGALSAPNVAAQVTSDASALRSKIRAYSSANDVEIVPRAGRPACYDGQRVDTSKWATPPWQPVLRDKALDAGGRVIPVPTSAGAIQGEWRVYARSASDDKAPIIAMLSAVDALKAAGTAPSVNLKFFFEGEEEAGSGHLRELLVKHADLLRADAWHHGAVGTYWRPVM